jgi:hypothetical protein
MEIPHLWRSALTTPRYTVINCFGNDKSAAREKTAMFMLSVQIFADII